MVIASIAITLALGFYGFLVAFLIRWFSKKSSKPQTTSSLLAIGVCGVAALIGVFEYIARSGSVFMVLGPLLIMVILGGQLTLRRQANQ